MAAHAKKNIRINLFVVVGVIRLIIVAVVVLISAAFAGSSDKGLSRELAMARRHLATAASGADDAMPYICSYCRCSLPFRAWQRWDWYGRPPRRPLWFWGGTYFYLGRDGRFWIARCNRCFNHFARYTKHGERISSVSSQSSSSTSGDFAPGFGRLGQNPAPPPDAPGGWGPHPPG